MSFTIATAELKKTVGYHNVSKEKVREGVCVCRGGEKEGKRGRGKEGGRGLEGALCHGYY